MLVPAAVGVSVVAVTVSRLYKKSCLFGHGFSGPAIALEESQPLQKHFSYEGAGSVLQEWDPVLFCRTPCIGHGSRG